MGKKFLTLRKRRKNERSVLAAKKDLLRRPALRKYDNRNELQNVKNDSCDNIKENSNSNCDSIDCLNVSSLSKGKLKRKPFLQPYRSSNDFRLKVENSVILL